MVSEAGSTKHIELVTIVIEFLVSTCLNVVQLLANEGNGSTLRESSSNH